MKFYLPIDVDTITPVRELGSGLAVTSFPFALRDGHRFEVQFFTGRDNGATAVRVYDDLELVFAIKQAGLLEATLPIVLHTAWTWDADLLCYVGKPSFAGIGLLGLFVGASTSRIESAEFNLGVNDVGTLIGCSHASTDITVTIPSTDFGAQNNHIDIVRGGAATVDIVADSGVTLTYAAGLNLASLNKAQIIRLTKTGSNAWHATLAPEADSVSAVGEFSWRSAAAPEDWSSTSPPFPVVIHADVYRGFEADIESLDTASNYATLAALALKANSADVYTKTQIDAHTGNTSNPHSVTKAQVGLANVDNTSDANKPISIATQTALDGKQPSLADVVTAGDYVFPCKLTLNAKGIITAIQATRRATLVNTVTASLSIAWLQGPTLDYTGVTLAVGDSIEMEMGGVVSSASTTTTELQFGVSSGATTVNGPRLNLGTAMGNNRQWYFRAIATVAAVSAGSYILRLAMTASVNPIAAGGAIMTHVAYVATSAHTLGALFPRCRVDFNSGSCSIHTGIIREI